MLRIIIFLVGFLLLVFTEILRVYYIMPFPGSQEEETLQLAYFIQNNIIWIRLLGLVLTVYPFYVIQMSASKVIRITLWVLAGFYIVVFYMFNYRYLADRIFLPPKSVSFLAADQNTKVKPRQLVIGITIGSSSRAYPIEIIGYHHQVRDTVEGNLVMVTYCTVCRTGRVYVPEVGGKPETFRLVGMDHYNAMFEDSRTRSWWRQVSGEAVIGPLQGNALKEIPSEQMTLEAWIAGHPDTMILQPDSTFQEAYDDLSDYDEGTRKGRLTRRDSLSWKDKSWVVGVQIGLDARAYDWNELVATRVMQDVLGNTPILLTLLPDSMTFHTFNRVIDGDTLVFDKASDLSFMHDTKTQSDWDLNGHCLEGSFKGKSLTPIQSYQEYWHSWRTFRPHSTAFNH